ncbi:MAG: acylglycerol kinase family protein [Candidatus Pacebacteria bacterium]|nr:acylglycerol kinase family protein [Candidatus Paceibacterota bacterium]
MHLYIYDDFLSKSRYNKVLSKIETRLTDLGLSGKIIRLNNLKNSDKAIKEEIKQGAKTIVAVGNDYTISKVLNVVMDNDLNYFSKDIVISFIPTSSSSLAESFGLINAQQACDVLLARRIKDVRLGKCLNNYFLSNIKILGNNTEILINKNYQITLLKNKSCYIINIPTKELSKKIPNIREKNQEKLFLFIENSNQDYSFFPADNIELKKQANISLIADHCITCQTPTEISLSEKRVRFIVGKNRAF